MPKELGDVVGAGAVTETFTNDGTVATGDSVAIDQGASGGDITATNSGDTDAGEEFGGVCIDDGGGSDGDTAVVALPGGSSVIANVASGVAAGNRGDVSATDGQLAASSGGPVQFLSDENGTWKGASLGSNEAAVHF
jgi:hypothetical protein